jgi:small conductance mechanosensitive channel
VADRFTVPRVTLQESVQQLIDQLNIDQRFAESVVFKAILLLATAIVLLLIYRNAGGVIHKVVVGLLRTQEKALTEGRAPSEELSKRAVTLETLLGKLVRAAVIVAIVVLIMAIFDLWPLATGFGLVAAALTLAGQSVVLDYIMGILILIEGEYYSGDWIVVDAGNGPLQGEVTEVGLRRTVLRDVNGAEHSISNAFVRVSSNMTRVFAISTVEFQVIRAQDVDRAMSVIAAVDEKMLADETWGPRMVDGPSKVLVAALTVDGATIRVRTRVAPQDRWTFASEMRRRIALALSEASISTVRWDALSPSQAQAVATAGPTPSDSAGSPGA